MNFEPRNKNSPLKKKIYITNVATLYFIQNY